MIRCSHVPVQKSNRHPYETEEVGVKSRKKAFSVKREQIDLTDAPNLVAGMRKKAHWPAFVYSHASYYVSGFIKL